MTADAPLPTSPFAIRDSRFYWTARFCATIAQMAMVIVIGWQVYDICRRTMGIEEAAFWLGMIGLVQFVPLFVLTLVTGWTADRIDRRYIARAVLALEFLCAATLAWATMTQVINLPILFAVAALLGVARAFAGPALGALAPNLVPRELLPKAIAMSSMAWQAASIGGPALGGWLYDWSHALPYQVSAVLFAVSTIAMFLIRPIARSRIEGSASPWRQMIDGLAYVGQNKLVLGAISLDMFAVLLGGATAMLPVFARDILDVGSGGLGLLRGAPAVGATLTAAWFSFRPLKWNVGSKMLVAVAVFGAATAVFGWSRWLPLSIGALAVLGAADMFSVFIRQSLIQLYTPDAMRGRVGAVSGLFISASNELGEARSGFLAALVGPTTAVVGGGIGAIVVTIIWACIFPQIRAARTFDPPEPPPERPPIVTGGV